MELPEINGPKHRLWFDAKRSTLHIEGSLRLSSDQYKPIAEFLTQVIEACAGGSVTLNLCDLEFLNSSGINHLYKFAIALRKRGDTALEVRGSNSVSWQSKSLSNITRFFPAATLTIT